MNINKALIIAAHPDDDILGCGGIISKLSSNTQFKVVFIAEGSTCRFNDPKCSEALNALNERNKHE